MTPRAFSQLIERVPNFVQIMGECESKEWITKIPGFEDDAGGNLWVLFKLRRVDEVIEDDDDKAWYQGDLYESFNDLDWINDPPRPLELLVQQFFLGQVPMWSHGDNNPMRVMHEAVRFVAATY